MKSTRCISKLAWIDFKMVQKILDKLSTGIDQNIWLEKEMDFPTLKKCSETSFQYYWRNTGYLNKQPRTTVEETVRQLTVEQVVIRTISLTARWWRQNHSIIWLNFVFWKLYLRSSHEKYSVQIGEIVLYSKRVIYNVLVNHKKLFRVTPKKLYLGGTWFKSL
jgi:hypothetical protein